MFSSGLDAAGKTTTLYKLKLGEVVTTIPTIGIQSSQAGLLLVSQATPFARAKKNAEGSGVCAYNVSFHPPSIDGKHTSCVLLMRHAAELVVNQQRLAYRASGLWLGREVNNCIPRR